MNCAECKFFDSDAPDTRGGRCRRFPPSFCSRSFVEVTLKNDLQNSDSWWHFPGVDSSDWCGEFQPASNRPRTVRAFNILEKLQEPVSILNLGKRFSECFRHRHIKTLSDLVRCHPDRILSFKHIGQKRLKKLIDKMAENNLALGALAK